MGIGQHITNSLFRGGNSCADNSFVVPRNIFVLVTHSSGGTITVMIRNVSAMSGSE